MTALLLGGLSLAIWLGLIFAHHGFWLTRERDTLDMPPEPATWPEVVAVVPARDEADVIARSIGISDFKGGESIGLTPRAELVHRFDDQGKVLTRAS